METLPFSEILNQKRVLLVDLEKYQNVEFDQISNSVKLSSSVEIKLGEITDDMGLLKLILRQILKKSLKY